FARNHRGTPSFKRHIIVLRYMDCFVHFMAKPKRSRANTSQKKSPSTRRNSDVRGSGGELHQQARGGDVLTTNQGVPVAVDQNTLRAGVRGPSLLEDFHFLEKMTHFDHERIPERIVHARGSAAHGVFRAYKGASKFTRAAFLQADAETPVFTRFSTVAGGAGSVDLPRDVRGFAV